MSAAQSEGRQGDRVRELMVQKEEISLKIKQLRVEMQRVNIDLTKAGASFEEIACW